MSKVAANAVHAKVEHLVSAAIVGHPADDETTRWVAGISETMHTKLAGVGLLPKRAPATSSAFLDCYIESRTDVKPATVVVYGHTRRNLVAHFGADKPLRDITPGDADGFRLYLIEQGLADNTVRRRCGIAKQFFGAAVRRKLLDANPFADLVAAVLGNSSRDCFVTLAEAAKVFAACPDAEWRLIFALSRFGGLRCSFEHLRLRWVDIDWVQGRFTVHSPKTEHHPGGGSRQVPLFPERLPYLRECFELAEPGAEYVITRYRRTNANLSTQLRRIIKRAGLTPWPKLYQNLRATRETELMETFPAHVVCAWMGNSQAVAQRHYLQVTDEHFRRSAGGDECGVEPSRRSAANALRHARAGDGTSENAPDADAEKQVVFAGVRDDAPPFNGDKEGTLGVTGPSPAYRRVEGNPPGFRLAQPAQAFPAGIRDPRPIAAPRHRAHPRSRHRKGRIRRRQDV